MATVNGNTQFVQHAVLQSKWVMGAADKGTPDQLARFPNHSVQISGTFGSGPATVLLEGSDDGVTYFTLKDNTGASISATSNARFDTIAIVPEFVRPSSSGGEVGVTAVTVLITSRSFGH